ncbi:MAG: glycosyltransferase family 9 protein [Candidatus Omnitrophota bacterium]
MTDGNKQKILLITLSNIGDVVLTTPAVDALRANFPGALLHVMTSPHAAGVFEKDKRIQRIILYDKHIKFKEKLGLLLSLRQENYSMVVDLRNTLFPLLLQAKVKTRPFHNAPQCIISMQERHLWKLKNLGIRTDGAQLSVMFDEQDKAYISESLRTYGMTFGDTIICVSPGARSHIKRWPEEKFLELCEKLTDKIKTPIVLIGDKQDRAVTRKISLALKNKIFDLSGLTTICQLACLLKNSVLLISNDSAPVHIAGSTNTPVVAIFGPTDPLKYGPASAFSAVVKKNLTCSPCEVAQCKFNHECMQQIGVDEVFEQVTSVLTRTQ